MAASEKHAPEHHRLFISLALPESIRTAIHLAQQEFRSQLGDACASWTRFEQLHMTLRFLGNVPIARIESLRDNLAIALKPHTPLKLTARAVGAFPQIRAPRVIWVGVEDAGGKLKQIHEIIQAATADFGLDKPEKRFTGHTTIARVKHLNRAERKVMSGMLEKFSNHFFGEWVASDIHLMRSILSPTGAQHSSVSTFELQKREVT